MVEKEGINGSPLGHYARQLTEEERERLEKDSEVVSQFRRDKLEQEARKNWDLFYKRNSTHFFKDRHWITREFPELLTELQNDGRSGKVKRVLLEAGCGVGNTLFPLINENTDIFVHACDFSPRAIDFVKVASFELLVWPHEVAPLFNSRYGGKLVVSCSLHPYPIVQRKLLNDHPPSQGHSDYNEERCHAFVCDLTVDPLSTMVPGGIDLASLMFVLSAITPGKMPEVMKNVFDVLREGGLLFFRDYGLYDHAQLRFSKGHKIEDNFYVRQDGTRAYYFSEERLAALALGAGYEILSNGYVQRETVNLKEDVHVPRIFLQAKLQKPTRTLR